MHNIFTGVLITFMLFTSSCGYSKEINISNRNYSTGISVPVIDTDEILASEHTTESICDVDYMEQMIQCCVVGDVDGGRKAASARNEKIIGNSLCVPQIDFDDLYELSKIITSEAGSSWLPTTWKMMVGEVILNRVASIEYPNTISEVIRQKGQYARTNGSYFENLIPFEDCVEVASRLLHGERLINDPSVVFQSSFKQGSGTYIDLYDSYYGHTYLCYSENPELYK